MDISTGKNYSVLVLNKLLVFLIILCSFQLVAQTIEKGYYMFPIRPGKINYLAGTMGELRSTHFHTGLDIKTNYVTGLPVYATADGYIMRAKVSIYGYGNVLYMAHPNETVTVYAHLREFQKDIADYVRNEQYKKESFTIDLMISKEKFFFKKGDIIAYSGNSGFSLGPHLHFEVRDKNNAVFNPLKYGFDEIKDDIAPILSKIAFVTMDKNSRVNGMFGRFEFDVVGLNGNYKLTDNVTLLGHIGIEVYAFDKLNGAKNKNGILQQTLLFDYKPVYNMNIDKIEFDKRRNILLHTNYKRFKEGGKKFNKYYIDDGNQLSYYDTNVQKGIIFIFDSLAHSIDIQLTDSYQNMAHYHFSLNNAKYSKNLAKKNTYFLNRRGYDINRNTLELISNSKDENCFTRIFMQGKEYLHTYSYKAGNKYFYLWDMNIGLPDSANICGKKQIFNFRKIIYPQKNEFFENESMQINFSTYSLFDTLYLQYDKQLDSIKQKEYFNFYHLDIPLQQFATITFKPQLEYDKLKSAVYTVNSKGRLGFVGGEWDGDLIKIKTRNLIKYTIATDTIPPKIIKLKSTKLILKFKISDNMSGIHSYRAELDGKWLMMYYDVKNRILISDSKVKLEGKFTIAIKDNANNFSRLELSF